jgi:hypothetical protein
MAAYGRSEIPVTVNGVSAPSFVVALRVVRVPATAFAPGFDEPSCTLALLAGDLAHGVGKHWDNELIFLFRRSYKFLRAFLNVT